MEDAYRKDLAYIHDAGFGAMATDAAQLLLTELDRAGLHQGTVTDLGCGSGILARQVTDAGYAVVGIDLSEAFIRIARERVPEAEFRVGSFISADLPSCVAITAIGEVLNYSFDERNSHQVWGELFQRSFKALVSGGLLMFDLAGRERATSPGLHRTFREGPDWAVLVEAKVDDSNWVLTRRITSFRKAGLLYRRNTETHRLLLAEPTEVLQSLRSAGFLAQSLTAYATKPLPGGVVAFLAQKPNRSSVK